METNKNSGVAAPKSPLDEEEKAAAAAAAAGQQQQHEVMALKKGPWTAAEDAMLVDHVRRHGEGNWNAVQRMTGLLRCGKSCRLRWTNHLRPNLKKGCFTPDEEVVIAQLHAQLGNKWARMAAHLPGRTDNEIKNYWNTRTKRRQRAGLPVYPPEVQLHLVLSKRCRFDELSPLAPPPQLSSESNTVQLTTMDTAAGGCGYTSARPAPLDLAAQQQQLAMTTTTKHQTVQFLSPPPPPFSAPSSPWARCFARNAHYFQFARWSPVSPSTPPDLSLGYQGSRHPPPLSPSPVGPRAELPSNQFVGQASAAVVTAVGILGGGGSGVGRPVPVPDQPNAASLEKMLQELHEAIKIDQVPAGDEKAVLEQHDHGTAVSEDKPEGELNKDDIETLFDLMIPPFNAAEHAPPADPAPNHSRSVSQQSSDDHDLPATSPDQEWSLDSACQWSNVSRIC